MISLIFLLFLAKTLVGVFRLGMRFAFTDCILDDQAHDLVRAGETVAIEPQVFDLLHLLVRNAGQLVTRDEIIAEVWQGRIVSDSAISARIAAARKAVGDDGKAQAIIRTVPRRGLMMVAEVTSKQEPRAAPQVSDEIQRIRYVRLPSGHSMAYAVTGSGPPVILVGSQSTDLEVEWQLSFERARYVTLSEHNTLIRFDPIGVGQSDRATDRLSVAQRTEEIGWLADALGLEKFAIYSQSGGCAMAMHFAAHNPHRVTRLAMLGGYVDGRALRDTDIGRTEEPLRTLIKAGWSQHGSEFVRAMIAIYQPEGPADSVKAFAQMIQGAVAPDLELRRRDVTNTHSSRAILSSITCPTLILHSSRDCVHPLSEARKLAAGIAGSELVVLDSSNHIPWLGNPPYETLQSTLIDFLAAEG